MSSDIKKFRLIKIVVHFLFTDFLLRFIIYYFCFIIFCCVVGQVDVAAALKARVTTKTFNKFHRTSVLLPLHTPHNFQTIWRQESLLIKQLIRLNCLGQNSYRMSKFRNENKLFSQKYKNFSVCQK